MTIRIAIIGFIILFAAGCQPPAAPAPMSPPPTPTTTVTPEIGVSLATQLPPTSAVLQITPSPIPTATPTATPTPIVYTIAAGDTLLALAFANNATLEEILALNPGVQPQLLQIGQQIILPPPAPPLFGQGGRSTPIPIQVAVLSVAVYQTPTDSFWLIGEVENQGALPVENVQVALTLFDAAANPAVTVSAWVVPGIIPAGARAPFAVRIDQPGLGAQVPQVIVAAGVTVSDLGSRSLDLAIADVSADYAESQLALTGTIRNDSAAILTALELVVTLYDAAGRVVGYQQMLLAGPLAPGNVAPFSLSAAPPGGAPAAYAILVMGWSAEP